MLPKQPGQGYITIGIPAKAIQDLLSFMQHT